MEEEAGVEQQETAPVVESMEDASDSAKQVDQVSNHYLHNLILSYLKHECFSKTAKSFASELAQLDLQDDTSNAQKQTDTQQQLSSSSSSKSLELRDQELELLDLRRRIVQLFREGDCLNGLDWANVVLRRNIQVAEGKQHKSSTDCFENYFPEVTFRVFCQHFVELIRQRKPLEALSFAQNKLGSYINSTQNYIERFQDYLALLAYEEPDKSPEVHLMSLEERERTAEEVNGCLANFDVYNSLNILSRFSLLERLIRQLKVIEDVLSELSDSNKVKLWSFHDTVT
eukprot:jgi/Galph1/882/GphlegSOOS_G5607.1